MKCQVTIIDDDGVHIREIIGAPQAIARTIAEFHADMQLEIEEGYIPDYTLLTEFNDEGVLR